MVYVKQLDPIATRLRRKYLKFCLWNLGNNREDENDVNRLFFVLLMKKNSERFC